MKDILVFISDQHSWELGFGPDPVIRTPNLDRLARAGTVMQNNYTACPLCVPARMSMMSGQLAGKCQVMNNNTALDSNRATFAHSFNAIGYETVLCGRMHFVGPDQRHGFSKRIAGDITPIHFNRPTGAFAQERGVHLNTPTGTPACLGIIGGGNSPTIAFDNYVVDQALAYLQEEHESPQLLVVGTYAPHHPYVAPTELFSYYYDRVTVPEETFGLPEHPALAGKVLCDQDPEVVRAVRASYYGLVEFEDQKIGQVYDVFRAYLDRTGHEGVFVYVSDHGDHDGYRGYYGKATFYEPSAHTPMVFVGDGIGVGKTIHGATCLTDLGPTLCELVGAPIAADTDGVSLVPQITRGIDDTERMVISEVGGGFDRKGNFSYGQMVKKGPYKLIHYYGFDDADVLYDVEQDPLETTNILSEHPDLVCRMRAFLDAHCADPEALRRRARELRANAAILGKCSFDSDERWRTPAEARGYPEILYSSRKFAAVNQMPPVTDALR